VDGSLPPESKSSREGNLSAILEKRQADGIAFDVSRFHCLCKSACLSNRLALVYGSESKAGQTTKAR